MLEVIPSLGLNVCYLPFCVCKPASLEVVNGMTASSMVT